MKIPVAQRADVSTDKPHGITVQGIELVLVADDEGVYAYQGHCPHEQGQLAYGHIRERHLVCDMHEWCFKLKTGQNVEEAEPSLFRFAISEAKGQLFIDSDDLDAWRNSEAAQTSPAPKLRRMAELPGPKPYPLLGNIPQIDFATFHRKMDEWVAEYGDTFRLKIGRTAFVSANPAIVQDAMKRRPHDFRRVKSMESIFKEMGLHGVFSAEGDDWKRQRRITAKGLSVMQLKHFYPDLLEVAEGLKAKWQKAASTGEGIDIREDFTRFTVDVTTFLTFGYNMNTLATGHGMIQEHTNHIFPTIYRRLNSPIPYWRLIKLPKDRAFDKAVKAMEQEVRRVIELTRDLMDREPERHQHPRNFLESLLAKTENGEEAFSETEIRGNVVTMLLAGQDTTANAMAWVAYYLAHQPELLQQLRQEVDTLLGDSPWPSYEQAQQMPLLEATTLEALRLKPIVPRLFLESMHDTRLGDVEIPGGTFIMLLTSTAGIQESNFEAPKAFNPQRWLNPNGGQPKPSPLIAPFGGGPRLCPGRALALLEIKVAIAMLVKHFDIALATPPEAVGEVLKFTMTPTNLKVTLSPRAGAF